MDPNRNNIDSCRVATDDCHLAYNDYHSFIETYFKTNFVTGKKTSKLSNYKQGLIVDIHGQSHPENWIELGYYFSISELNLAVLPNALSSSVNTLRSLSNYSLEEIIRGQVSLGGIFENKFGLKSVPSPTYPSPRNGKSMMLKLNLVHTKIKFSNAYYFLILYVKVITFKEGTLHRHMAPFIQRLIH